MERYQFLTRGITGSTERSLPYGADPSQSPWLRHGEAADLEYDEVVP
jgi:hypothetical protein